MFALGKKTIKECWSNSEWEW